jgi:integrase/recombinase XerC
MTTHVLDFILHLQLVNRKETARGYKSDLVKFEQWLQSRGKEIDEAKTEDLLEYQEWLANEYISPKTNLPISVGSQATRIAAVKSLYKWLFQNGTLLYDIGEKVKLPKVTKGTATSRDYLSLQGTIAVVETMKDKLNRLPTGTRKWAKQYRLLTLFCMAFATGLRRNNLRSIKVEDLDFKRSELRVERVKGKPGRVLPVKKWAMDVAEDFIRKARPLLVGNRTVPFLLVGDQAERIGTETLRGYIEKAIKETRLFQL